LFRQGAVHGRVGEGCVLLDKVDIGDVVDSPDQVALHHYLRLQQRCSTPKAPRAEDFLSTNFEEGVFSIP
jgi:hypothetical protein